MRIHLICLALLSCTLGNVHAQGPNASTSSVSSVLTAGSGTLKGGKAPSGLVDLPTLEAGRVHLPNGWSLTPAGTSLPLGDLPLNIAVSRSGKYAAVTNNGESIQSIQLFDTRKNVELDSVDIGTAWGGLIFSEDERSLYASGGNDNWIIKYAIRDGKLINSDTIVLGGRLPNKVSPTGIALDDKRKLLYTVTKENNSLYIVDLPTKKILRQEHLEGEGYTCLLSPDKKELYISIWGKKEIQVYNTETNSFTGTIGVGNHPNDLCLSKNGRFLFVANANDNSVSVIDTRDQKVLETLNSALYPDSRPGATTNGVALSPDEKTLFIANADLDCLAVFDVHQPGASVSKGFIPTGWYPTSVRVTGKQLFVSNGKGFSSFANPLGPNPGKKTERVILHGGDTTRKRTQVQYIGGGLLMGTLSMIPIPSDKQLAVYSRAVYNNTPYKKETELLVDEQGETNNPVPAKVGLPSPVKHVFYIVKENRSFDQVLSDVSGGNGDTSLLLFGDKVTPNQHAIARDFVLLDNFYVDGEVSADGHMWSDGAYASDYMEKIWPSSYGNRGGELYTSQTVFGKSYIWDQAKKAGITYRTYGEFAARGKAYIPSVVGHFSPTYTELDMKMRDTARITQWEREFDSMIVINAVPALNTIRLSNDHTEGTTPGRPTIFAHVADNDLAVGLLIDHLSHSPIWKESVVFILEDDAQNGPDHVDAHRSPAYVAGGYVKRHFVDHTMYSTSAMVHTIELILGMEPMSLYDAGSIPMWRSFTAQADATPFNAKPSNIDLNDKNPSKGKLAMMAKGLDFSKEDQVPDQIMNAMLWKFAKGEDAIVPAPTHAAFFKAAPGADKD
jgi:YVTN family beta-propeller protein